MSNNFSCVGTVTRDAEVRISPSGGAVLNVNVANNQGYSDKQTTMFISVALWGKRAEGQLVNYLKKGQAVFVSGELSQKEYKALDGTMKTSLNLNCNILDLVGKKQDTPAASYPAQDNHSAAKANAYQPNNVVIDGEFDELPF